MSEPTIDEMLGTIDALSEFVEQNNVISWGAYQSRLAAIRAILEQHRDDGNVYIRTDKGLQPVVPGPVPVWPNELEAIRAFVERVLNKYDDAKLATELPWEEFLEEVLQDELAALEKEVE
jgi:hypothetical protein